MSDLHPGGAVDGEPDVLLATVVQQVAVAGSPAVRRSSPPCAAVPAGRARRRRRTAPARSWIAPGRSSAPPAWRAPPARRPVRSGSARASTRRRCRGRGSPAGRCGTISWSKSPSATFRTSVPMSVERPDDTADQTGDQRRPCRAVASEPIAIAVQVSASRIGPDCARAGPAARPGRGLNGTNVARIWSNNALPPVDVGHGAAPTPEVRTAAIVGSANSLRQGSAAATTTIQVRGRGSGNRSPTAARKPATASLSSSSPSVYGSRKSSVPTARNPRTPVSSLTRALVSPSSSRSAGSSRSTTLLRASLQLQMAMPAAGDRADRSAVTAKIAVSVAHRRSDQAFTVPTVCGRSSGRRSVEHQQREIVGERSAVQPRDLRDHVVEVQRRRRRRRGSGAAGAMPSQRRPKAAPISSRSAAARSALDRTVGEQQQPIGAGADRADCSARPACRSRPERRPVVQRRSRTHAPCPCSSGAGWPAGSTPRRSDRSGRSRPCTRWRRCPRRVRSCTRTWSSSCQGLLDRPAREHEGPPRDPQRHPDRGLVRPVPGDVADHRVHGAVASSTTS